jgi:hypothetical protein
VQPPEVIRYQQQLVIGDYQGTVPTITRAMSSHLAARIT